MKKKLCYNGLATQIKYFPTKGAFLLMVKAHLHFGAFCWVIDLCSSNRGMRFSCAASIGGCTFFVLSEKKCSTLLCRFKSDSRAKEETMKAIVCQMCGSREIVQQNGLLVCQSCGTRYYDDTRRTRTENQKFCIYCGETIHADCVVCPKCGRQVQELKAQQPTFVFYQPPVNQTPVRQPSNVSVNAGTPKDKWVALMLCIFLGYLGAHKFYEGNSDLGILYLFTCGLFGIGWIIDIFQILSKPNPYYV